MMILVVEDEPSERNALLRLLEGEHHRTCWAGSGRMAVALMRSEKPDLVLLDLTLEPGGWSGMDVARVKAADPELRGIPLVIVSGREPDDIRTEAAMQNPLAQAIIVSKPLDNESLMRTIRGMIGEGQ